MESLEIIRCSKKLNVLLLKGSHNIQLQTKKLLRIFFDQIHISSEKLLSKTIEQYDLIILDNYPREFIDETLLSSLKILNKETVILLPEYLDTNLIDHYTNEEKEYMIIPFERHSLEQTILDILIFKVLKYDN